MSPHARDTRGHICGIGTEDIGDPLMRKIRRMDKASDELAEARALEKKLRS